MCCVVFIGVVVMDFVDLVSVVFGVVIKLMFLYDVVGSGCMFGCVYIICCYYFVCGELEIDFVVYDEMFVMQYGLVVCWFEYVVLGDEVEFVGFKCGFCVDFVVLWMLFIGDEMVLFVIFVILEILFEYVQVLIYIVIGDVCVRLFLEGVLVSYLCSCNIYWVESDMVYVGVMMVGVFSVQFMLIGMLQVFLVGEVFLFK